ncbi:OLC1v1002465C3 [Oldenlandia corymbosa var. corymbosa]|uniref:OLC1v1002465C3 n=1 Tax=Oldenlandia corymbosa var. corymbosa TaxID=529605 RepID=A0AAV1D7R4_OLDCO|nr:OLC1v1002465C3 [Oldenlandia corymbosa var. corymbosa]
MGKASQQQLPVVRQQQQEGAAGERRYGGVAGVFCCRRCSTAISRVSREFNFKCVFVLIMSVAIFWVALSSLLHIRHKNYGYDAKESIKISAVIQAHFILQKPVSQLVHHIAELEYDIFGEIGVPDTKVVILSMHPANVSNITNVVFGVLSNPPNASLNPVFSSLLKSTCVELFLQQSNLTLTNITFGQPTSFEILKFPGGITLIPEQLSPIGQIPQILFTFSLSNSVQEIKDKYSELKRQLRVGLDLMPNEIVYIQVTNEKGSTIDPPLIVEASVTTNFGHLSPQRLKELGDKIKASHAKNLGLDKVIFGKVKEVKLSAALNGSFDAMPPAPSPSPLSAPSPSPSFPSPQFDPPAPAPNSDNSAPCSDCDASAPSHFSIAYAPSSQDQHRGCSPSVPSSSGPSMAPRSRRRVISSRRNVNEKIVESMPHTLPLSSASSSCKLLLQIAG